MVITDIEQRERRETDRQTDIEIILGCLQRHFLMSETLYGPSTNATSRKKGRGQKTFSGCNRTGMVCGYGGRVCLCLCVGVCVWAGGGALSCRRTFDVVVDDVVGMQVFQASEHMLGHPNDLKLPHGPTAVEQIGRAHV